MGYLRILYIATTGDFINNPSPGTQYSHLDPFFLLCLRRDPVASSSAVSILRSGCCFSICIFSIYLRPH